MQENGSSELVYYFASIFLSKEAFDSCTVLYSFCRQIDDIADKQITIVAHNIRFDTNIILSDGPISYFCDPASQKDKFESKNEMF